MGTNESRISGYMEFLTADFTVWQWKQGSLFSCGKKIKFHNFGYHFGTTLSAVMWVVSNKYQVKYLYVRIFNVIIFIYVRIFI